MKVKAKVEADWLQRVCALRLVICSVGAAIAPHIAAESAIAQITLDETLGSEASSISPNVIVDDEPSLLIEGGATREHSLFHSFEQFNVGETQRVYFANPANISTIFSRVTGTDASDILGTLGISGPADLFFINPNGILFGPDAGLDIDGSLFVSTAESLVFDNDITYSATSSQSLPLLTVSAPLGLQYGSSPGAVSLRGRGHHLSLDPSNPGGLRIVQDNRSPGLQVLAQETLALLGGDVTLAGANITTEGGRIEIGSVGAESFVDITKVSDRWSASYDSVERFGDIELTAASSTVAAGDGEISLSGGRIVVNQNAVVLATNGASVNVAAAESLRLLGLMPDFSEQPFPTGLLLQNEPGSGIDAGALTVKAPQLSVENGAGLITQNFGAGTGGNINIQSQQLQIDDSLLVADSFATGASGHIGVKTDQLTLRNQAAIATNSFASGRAGNVTVQTNSGDGGNISLRVDDVLLLRNGGELSATASSASAGGNGGDISIEAGFIVAIARENSDISANAFNGRGGSISINTQGILGLESRDQPTFRSDITANSELGRNGFVVINTPVLVPSAEEPTLPSNVRGPLKPIDQSICSGDRNEFTLSGTGGLPTSPYDTLSGSVTWEDWYISGAGPSVASSLDNSARQREDTFDNLPTQVFPAQNRPEEAKGWDVDANGNIILLLDPRLTSSAAKNSLVNSVSCRQLRDALKLRGDASETFPDTTFSTADHLL